MLDAKDYGGIPRNMMSKKVLSGQNVLQVVSPILITRHYNHYTTCIAISVYNYFIQNKYTPEPSPFLARITGLQ